MSSQTDLPKIQVALVVHTCDRYQFLYEGFSFFFSKYWDFNIDCNYYFVTEKEMVSVAGFENVRSGSGEWSDRLRHTLTNIIKEDYVLYLQEDMWLNKKINATFFNQLFDLTAQNDWQQVKLHSSNVYQTAESTVFIEGFNVAKVDNKASDYLMSHQVTLWNKDFLVQQLHRGEHPWRNERKGTKRLKQLNPSIFQIDYFAENDNPAINQNNNPVLRSGYRTVSVNSVLDECIVPYIEELKSSGAKQAQYAQQLEYNYANNLTHDGRAKPRKADFFKQIKNWLIGKQLGY
jgi:hypothetical protein